MRDATCETTEGSLAVRERRSRERSERLGNARAANEVSRESRTVEREGAFGFVSSSLPPPFVSSRQHGQLVKTPLPTTSKPPHVHRCRACDSEAEFLYTCPECGDRFCADHVDPQRHHCPALDSPAPTDSTGASAANRRQIVLAVGFFALVVASLAGFLWVLGPTGPFADTDGMTPATTTAADAPAGRLVLQAVNDERAARNRSPIGYYAPLAELAANRSWPGTTASPEAPVSADAEVACTAISTLEYRGSIVESRERTESEAVVEAWVEDPDTRAVLLTPGWTLGGAAVTASDGETRVRLVVCNSTADS